MTAAVGELTEIQAEQLRLFAAFCDLRLDERDALALAEAGASPSEARIMIERGCPPDLIAEILA